MPAAPVARLAALPHGTPAGAAGQQASLVEFAAETSAPQQIARKTRAK